MMAISSLSISRETFSRWLTRRQVAERYNRDVQTISRWEREGKIPKGIRIGRTVAFSESLLEAHDAQKLEEALKG